MWPRGFPNSLIKVGLLSLIFHFFTYYVIGIIAFQGSSVVDCADNLQTGAEMLLQLRVYFLPEAFKQHRLSSSSDDPRSMFNEGQETLDEQNLRERKASLQHLFNAIDLTPKRTNAFLRDSNSNTNILESVTKSDQAAHMDKKRMAGLSEVEEGEESDAELLSEGQLDMIYTRFEIVFIVLTPFG